MNKDWNTEYEEKGLRAQRMYPNEALLQYMGSNGLLSGDKSLKILEIGCGSGANLWMMAKEGHKVYGTDISEEALNIAHIHLEEKWNVAAEELKVGTFTDIPFLSNEFDLVVDVVSMQHICLADTENALSEVKRVLKPGGRFFSVRLGDGCSAYRNGMPAEKMIDAVTVENISSTDMPLNNNGTMSFWSPGIARNMYEKAELEIESLEQTTRTYQNGKYIVEYLVIAARKAE